MWAIVIFASFTVLFNTSFEQAGGTMTIFAMQYTERVLTGTSAIVFMVIDMITTIVPILIISWVLFLLLKKTIKTYLLSGIILASSFIMIWLIVGWKINRELDTKTYLVEYKTVIDKITNKETGKKEELTSIVKASTILKNNSKIVGETIKIKELDKIKIGTNVWLFDTDNNGSLKYISNEKAKGIEVDRKVEAKVLKLENKDQHEAVTERIEKVENKLEEVIKFRWIIVGVFAVVSLGLSQSHMVVDLLTPDSSQIQIQKTK